MLIYMYMKYKKTLTNQQLDFYEYEYIYSLKLFIIGTQRIVKHSS